MMKLAAFIFCLIGTIFAGFAIFPLIWCIPMTVHAYRAYKDDTNVSIAFGVCTLLFVSLVGGILFLVDTASN